MSSIQIFAHIGTGIGPFLIRLGTMSQYSHVGFYDQDTNISYESVTHPGVIKNVGLDYITTELKMFSIELSVYQKMQLLVYLDKQVGKPYDWTSIFKIYDYKRDWKEDDSWFCSELVAAALSHVGIQLVRKPCGRITPIDVVSSVVLKPLYE